MKKIIIIIIIFLFVTIAGLIIFKFTKSPQIPYLPGKAIKMPGAYADGSSL